MVAADRPMAVDVCSQARCVFRLVVIDSSRSGHGPADTPPSTGGAGKGVIQLQTSRDGRFQGYRWSERSSSRWSVLSEESLLVGRFMR